MVFSGEPHWLDLVQTIALIVNSAALVYVIWQLSLSFSNAAEKLRRLINAQHEIQESIERIWKRVDEIETQQGTRQTVMPLGKLQERLASLEARIKALEIEGPK
jgi:peptidoglycan hydrolase CwlO-like protein